MLPMPKLIRNNLLSFRHAVKVTLVVMVGLADDSPEEVAGEVIEDLNVDLEDPEDLKNQQFKLKPRKLRLRQRRQKLMKLL